MERIRIAAIEQLREKVREYGPEALFRGQTTHYEQNGLPSIETSFDRKGCIPPEMIKWSNYARGILRPILRTSVVSLELTHAILQHYGWRSWYVDCTMNPAVATWFASHKYSERPASGIYEDYKERPVYLDYRLAEYDFEEGDAHFYVLDSTAAAFSCGLTDLSAIRIPNAKSRADAQSAWILGPLQNRSIPQKAFLAHISGPRSVFRTFAEEARLVHTSDLFPSPKDDPILEVLLSLPWRMVGDLGPRFSGLPVGHRSLSLPEHQRLEFKIAQPNVAFYDGRSIGDPPNEEGILVPVGQDVLYGVPGQSCPAHFPKVTALVRRHKTVVFECSELLRHPHMTHSSVYQKGVAAQEQPGGLIALGELVVEHPGLDLLSSGIARPWFYQARSDGSWARESHPEECDCADDACHLRHLESLKIVEGLLG